MNEFGSQIEQNDGADDDDSGDDNDATDEKAVCVGESREKEEEEEEVEEEDVEEEEKEEDVEEEEVEEEEVEEEEVEEEDVEEEEVEEEEVGNVVGSNITGRVFNTLSRYARQWSRIGHDAHLGALISHKVAPSSMIAWFNSPEIKSCEYSYSPFASSSSSYMALVYGCAFANASIAACEIPLVAPTIRRASLQCIRLPFVDNGFTYSARSLATTRLTLQSTTGSGMPNAREAIAPAVYGPMPGTVRSEATL